ncbi:Spindle pole body component SPC97 [Spathaspora sp. JA1]|nr:Spindle pole body component SPC97 [Spathaspora sp. JA1]
MNSFASSPGGGRNVPPDVVTLNDTYEDFGAGDMHNIVTSHLVTHTTKKPTKIKAPLVSQITDLQIQQGLIIRDLLFALLGYEGIFIKYSEKYDPKLLHWKINGPDFKIAKNLDLSLKTVTKKLSKLGRYYCGLVGFVQTYDCRQYGKVIQRFCFVIQEFLSFYNSVIVGLEQEFQYNSSFNLTKLDQILNQEVSNKLVHLYEIAIEIHSITQERKITQNHSQYSYVKSNLIDSKLETNLYLKKFDCCKGGLALRVIQSRLSFYKGEPSSFTFLTQILDTVAEDYLEMLNTWLSEGKIDDPFDEFFIREKEVPVTFVDIFDNRSEYYWNELFLIKPDGLLEQFENSNLQSKILTTGKYLNIFKKCIGLSNFGDLHENLKFINKLSSQDIELKINQFYNRANKLIMKLLFQGYNFRSLILHYQTQFLFDNSYKIDKFIDLAFGELKRDKYKVSISRLQKQYYDLYNTSNRKIHKIGTIPSILDIIQERQRFTISNESLYQVAHELMQSKPEFDIERVNSALQREGSNSPQETTIGRTNQAKQPEDSDDNIAIASINLSVELPFPLNLVINRELSYHYEMIFKLLMNLKFLARYNDINAKELNKSDVWKYPGYDTRIKTWILRIRSLHSRIRLFLDELQSYINYDVIEVNYSEINTLLKQTEIELSETELGTNVGVQDHEDEQLFNTLQGTGNSNSIFETRILDAELRRPSSNSNNNTHNKTDLLSLDNLILQLRKYLNTVLTESLLGKYELLFELKQILDYITKFNHYISLYKKTLILCDRNLHEQYSDRFPDRFKNKTMDSNSIDKRFTSLNNSLMEQYRRFAELLASFLDKIRKFGLSENGGLLALSDRLEQCFPE